MKYISNSSIDVHLEILYISITWWNWTISKQLLFSTMPYNQYLGCNYSINISLMHKFYFLKNHQLHACIHAYMGVKIGVAFYLSRNKLFWAILEQENTILFSFTLISFSKNLDIYLIYKNISGRNRIITRLVLQISIPKLWDT